MYDIQRKIRAMKKTSDEEISCFKKIEAIILLIDAGLETLIRREETVWAEAHRK